MEKLFEWAGRSNTLLKTNLTELLLQCVAESDPILTMLEWLCEKLSIAYNWKYAKSCFGMNLAAADELFYTEQNAGTAR